VIVGDFNTPLLPIYRSRQKKKNKEIVELKDTIDLIDLTNVYRVFCPITAQYTFFSAAHGTFSKIDHMRGHKASFNEYKKIEIIPCILSDHNAIKLEFKKRNSRKYANNWRLNNMLLNNQWVIGEEIKKFLEFNKMKTHKLSEPMGHSKGSAKGKVYSHECIY
jgi:hypothetical protein